MLTIFGSYFGRNDDFILKFTDHQVKSFDSIKYRLSINTSNFCQMISVMKTKKLVFPEKRYFKNSSFWHFNSCFILKHLFQIIEKKTQTENRQLFDGIIDATLFDGVEGLNFNYN